MSIRCLRWDGADGWQWQADGGLRQGGLAGAVAVAGSEPVRVLLASPQTWVCALILPRLSAGRLATAAAFALEDQLAVELDALQVAVGKRHADGLTELAVIGRADLDQALAQLGGAGLVVSAIVPIASLLPADAATVLAEPDWLTVRLAGEASLCGPPAQVMEWLRALAPPSLRWLQTPGGPAPTSDIAAEVTAVPADEALRLGTSDGLDLLQGAYAPVRERGHWRPAAVLAGVWLALLLAGGLVETQRLSQRNTALKTAIEQEFRELFPQEGPPVSLRAQAQRRLKLLAGGAPGGGVLPLLTVAARALPAGQTLTALDYKEGALTLDFSLPDVAAVEVLREALATDGGAQAELPVAVAEGGAVRTRLVLRPTTGSPPRQAP